MIQYFVEVPNTNIKEPVGNRLGDAWGICYDLAQENGFAEVVWYALNGKRVSEGGYTDRDWNPVRAWGAVMGAGAPLIENRKVPYKL